MFALKPFCGIKDLKLTHPLDLSLYEIVVPVVPSVVPCDTSWFALYFLDIVKLYSFFLVYVLLLLYKKFVHQVIKITQNEALLNQLGNAAYEKVKEYSTKSIVEMYVNALSSMHKK